MSENNHILLSQLPKQLWKYLIDSKPRLKIVDVAYRYHAIAVYGSISYLDENIPIELEMEFDVCNFQEIPAELDDDHKYIHETIDDAIVDLKNRTKCVLPDTITTATYFGGRKDDIHDSDIKIGFNYFSFEFSDTIISFLEFVKKISNSRKNPEYIKRIYDIYMKYYPNSKMWAYLDDYSNYGEDLEYLFNYILHYDHHEYDLDEYEVMCQTGKYEECFPICYCTEESKLYGYHMGHQGNTMMALKWCGSCCCSSNTSTDLLIRYLLPKKDETI